MLLTGYQTPAALRQLGRSRLEAWLRDRKVRNAATVAATAVDVANAQHTTVPGEQLAADMVTRLAHQVIALNEKITELDTLIEDRFRQHRHAEIILSMPGFGPLLGAEFLAATRGDPIQFDTPDRLAGLAPAPRDSGRLSGNLRRPRRYDRRLLRTSYLAALNSARPHGNIASKARTCWRRHGHVSPPCPARPRTESTS